MIYNYQIITKMKRSILPLLHILLIIVVAVTLSFQVMLFGGGFISIEAPLAGDPAVPVFNSTLLRFAAIDVSEPGLVKEIQQLVDGNFGNQGRHRTFMSSGKPRADIRARSARGIPVDLNSLRFYKLWLEFRRHLQIWRRKRRFEPNIMLEMADLVKGAIDRYNGLNGVSVSISSSKTYKKCAVVGNSGILLKSKFGKLIDSHDIVIRLNNARIASFKANVGSKTTISFINSNILHLCARKDGCFCHPYGENVPIVMYMCQPVHFLDYAYCNSSKKSAPLIITDPRLDVLCARIVKYYSAKRFVEKMGKDIEDWNFAHDAVNFHYSSGLQAVMVALGNCEKVSIFGFGKSVSAKHHYHTNQKAELRLHDYEAEYDFYHDLVHRPQVVPFISINFKFPPVVIYQ